MLEYDPPAFYTKLLDQPVGMGVWAYLNSLEAQIRMETATYLGKPAIEALSPQLNDIFGNMINNDEIHKMMGHMVKKIMEARGYTHVDDGIKIESEPNIFKTAALYS